MKIEDERSSILYFDDLVNKTFRLYTAVKTLTTLLKTPYSGPQMWRLEEQIKEQLRQEIIDDLFFIVDNINRPEVLANRMAKLSIGARYGWSGHDIEMEMFH